MHCTLFAVACNARLREAKMVQKTWALPWRGGAAGRLSLSEDVVVQCFHWLVNEPKPERRLIRWDSSHTSTALICFLSDDPIRCMR